MRGRSSSADSRGNDLCGDGRGASPQEQGRWERGALDLKAKGSSFDLLPLLSELNTFGGLVARIAWLRAEIARLTALAHEYRRRALIRGRPGSVGLFENADIRYAERAEALIVRYRTELAQLSTIHSAIPVPSTDYIQPVVGPPTSDQPPAAAAVTAAAQVAVESQAASALAPIGAPGPFWKQPWFLVAAAASAVYLITRRG